MPKDEVGLSSTMNVPRLRVRAASSKKRAAGCMAPSIRASSDRLMVSRLVCS